MANDFGAPSLDTCDVAVVGGGIVGVCSAFLLRRRGFDVTLIEQRHVAYGASGRNPGFLTVAFKEGPNLALATAGRRMYEELFVEELGDCFEYRRNGCLVFFTSDAEERLYREYAAARAEDGLHMEVLGRDAAHEFAPLLPEHVSGAVLCHDDGQIRTAKLLAALAHVCRRMGVRIYERTPAMRILRQGSEVRGVRTLRGHVLADRVVCAAGVWSRLLLEDEGIEVPVAANKTTIMETDPVPLALPAVAFGPRARFGSVDSGTLRSLAAFDEEAFAEDDEDLPAGTRFGELVAQRPDGRLLYGDAHEFPSGLDHHPSVWAVRTVQERFAERFPDLQRLGIRRIWSGLIPRTPDLLPIIASVDEPAGLYVVSGHFAGNLEGPMSAQLVTEMIAGDEPSLPLDPFGIDRPAIAIV